MGLLPGRPAESLLSRLRREPHDPAGRTSRIHRNPRTTHGDLVRRNRGAGWQALHVAIDDHSRWLYAEVLPSERAEHCTAFLRRAVLSFAERGIQVERVLSDNARTYRGNLWRDTCSELEIERRFTPYYRPQVNGKAERVIQTLLNEWAYGRAYSSSEQRTRALASYLRWHNHRRPHSSLGNRPPISRVSHLCGHDN